MSEQTLRVGIGFLTLAGAGISAYLLETRLAGGSLVCTTGGCETVQRSGYSELLRVPVAAVGLVAYLTLLATALARSPLAAVAGATVALSGAAFSGYLLVLQLTVIDAVCEWCVASDVTINAAAMLAIVRVRQLVVRSA